ncbi:glycosyl hydrolase [Paenibacillus agricola]|uniref:Glycosyl hydrolase n=1 Tax=Paenibacillus agricola TaxID=2716264 RepID=A0ABX0J6B8_9BACL|nr:glycosyl hydrolase [Paenibacillus agricola]NHN31895.1 glycosyl hydrolase [Paenibacillus agricola]
MAIQPKLSSRRAPLFRDPIYDGAADPTLIWNRQAKEWWMIYTNRRATSDGVGVQWVHGTDLGVASSADGGQSWLYRGTLAGLELEWGRNTFWAPEVYWHEGVYHMYVSYIQGVPLQWEGHKREILHYTSPDLLQWTFRSRLQLSSERVIDACVHTLPDGRFRMWYKDEDNQSHTYAADSEDLYNWHVVGAVITDRAHEGPNVFILSGSYWMIVDEWRGQGVYQSEDGSHWVKNGLILDQPGQREDDQAIGLHADVVVQGEHAYIFYFTHPERIPGQPERTYKERRSSIQVAKLEVIDGKLICDRDAPFGLQLVEPE